MESIPLSSLLCLLVPVFTLNQSSCQFISAVAPTEGRPVYEMNRLRHLPQVVPPLGETAKIP